MRQRIDCLLPPSLALALAGAGSQNSPPIWRPALQPLAAPELSKLPGAFPGPSNDLRFTFLNQTRQLAWPISWNDPLWERLWQFHLHYFDWARHSLEQALTTGHWSEEAQPLELLLDHWIAANTPRSGDGWHSYTISLRTRNWIWLFRCCPALATPPRLRSLWQQLRWLASHPEHCHGGNHWLENLTALAIGSLQFEGGAPRAMQDRALRLLRYELTAQLLDDGGHEERSTSYHLLMLDRLVELACTLASVSGERPAWLLQAIAAMSGWARDVRLEGGQSPRFNDSAADAAPPLDEVVEFAEAFLQGRSTLSTCDPSSPNLRQRLLKSAVTCTSLAPFDLLAAPQSTAGITDLPATGWTILRPGHHWEVLFKCGIPCPDHLPAHVHSDQLSVEVSHRGIWLIAEAGTSVYGTGPDRAHERSGGAHNVLQLGHSTAPGTIHWVEPVDVWHGFRAGRKAQPRHRDCGRVATGSSYVEGSHDGFDRLGAQHHRRVELLSVSPDRCNLQVLDTVTATTPLHFRLWWHLGPEVADGCNELFRCEAASAQDLVELWQDTWFSVGFGQRVSRRSYSLQGLLPPGQHRLQTNFQLSNSQCLASG